MTALSHYSPGSAGTPSDGYKTRNFRPDPTPAPVIPRQRDTRHDTRGLTVADLLFIVALPFMVALGLLLAWIALGDAEDDAR